MRMSAVSSTRPEHALVVGQRRGAGLIDRRHDLVDRDLAADHAVRDRVAVHHAKPDPAFEQGQRVETREGAEQRVASLSIRSGQTSETSGTSLGDGRFMTISKTFCTAYERGRI